MKKDEKRNNAIFAFRKYAKLGLDQKELAAFEAYERMRGACENESSALDMLAVYDTLRILRASGEEESVSAIERVYFASRGRRPGKNEISMRVRSFSTEHFCDERTVYRRLRGARELYIKIRNSEAGEK